MSKTVVQLSWELTEEEERYLDTSARIRRISRTRLMERLITAIVRDQMILGVLDDNSKPDLSADERSFYRERRSVTPRIAPRGDVGST